jgi:hypothetical protein
LDDRRSTLICYLIALLISGPYSTDDRIINKPGAVDVGREKFFGENLPLCYFVHYKSNMA